MKKRAILILAAAWLAGIVSIIYELVWVRYLGLILGNSVYAVGVVTACYMTGLALGDFLIGKGAGKNRRFYTILAFGGLACYCFLSPLLYQAVLGMNQWLAGILPNSGAAMMAGRICTAFPALCLPTFFMGGILPVLVEANSSSSGKIYAVHTLGAVTGAVLTGFYLIKSFGLSRSAAFGGILMAAALLLVLAAGCSKPSAEKEASSKKSVCSLKIKKAVIAAYTLSGFTGMAFQVYQTRILTLFFMDSVYDFAIILAVYLAGLCIGNTVSASLARRTKQPAGLLAGTQMLLGISCAVSLYFVSRLPYWTEGLNSRELLLERFGAGYFSYTILMKAGYTCLLVAVPAVLWGMAYPLVSKICVEGSGQSGRSAGVVLGFNTIGSAFGSFLASFILISVLGIQKSLMVNSFLNILAGILILAVCGTLKNRRSAALPAAAAVVFAVLLALVPPWNRFEMSSSFLKPGQDVDGYVDIRFYKEDANGITSVIDFLPYNQTYLTTNRLYCQNTSDMNGPEDHRRLGYLPLLIHQNPKKVLVEGLGAGITLRGVAEYGGLEIDCVEISGAIAEAAACFQEENGDVLKTPGLELTIDDARNYLLTTKETYDVVIADIFFPMSSGSSSMFSTEYYESCRSVLNPGGIMAQWIPLHQFSEEELEITMKTFCNVFPHTSLWFGMIGTSVPAAGLVGSDSPLELSYQRLEEIYGDGFSEMALDETALDDPYMFLSHFISEITPESFGPSVAVNTDDRPVLEFLNPKESSSYRQRGQINLRNMLERKQSAGPYVNFYEESQLQILSEYDEQIRAFIEELE